MAANIRCIMRAKAPYGQGITKMKVNFTPTQSGTPWQSDEVNNAPYVFRQIPMGNREWNKLVGGTVAWNQLVTAYQTTEYAGIKREMVGNTLAEGLRVYGTSTVAANFTLVASMNNLVNGHKYLWTVGNVALPSGTHVNFARNGQDKASATVYPIDYVQGFGLYINSGVVIDVVVYPQIIDLTQFFNPTIADYVYSLEQSQAGSGIAWLKKYDLIDDQYHAYSAGSLESVNVSAHVMRDADNNIIETYPTDSSVTLRGMLKKDADGNLYYDGDEFLPDGTVKRYWGERAYQSGDASDGSTMITDGTNTVYKLTTPTTETATPFTMWQVCDPDGTEEWADYGVEQGTRDYAVPVGHESTYAMAYPIEGVDSFTVTANDGTSHTYPVTLSEEIYRGYVDMLTGEAVSDMASIAEYNGETINAPWLSSLDVYAPGATPTRGAQVVYPITPEEVTATITGDPSTLSGVVSATSTKGTVEWSELSEIGIKCIMKRKNPFQ